MKKTFFLLLSVLMTSPAISHCEELGKDAVSQSPGEFGMTFGTSSSQDYGRLLGMSVFILPSEGIAFYASYRDNGDEEGEPFYADYDLVDSNDTLVSRMQEISLFSMGLTKLLTAHLGICGGWLCRA